MDLRSFSVIGLAAGLLCSSPVSLHAAAAKAKRKTPPPQVQQAVAPVAVAPPVELTLAQKPAVPPQVSFQNNELTIVAENSTLGDILRAVHVQTGATIEVPPNATERVVSKLGPGPARTVLASLLHGSHFDYVILGTAADPNRVERVVLMTRTGGGETTPITPAPAQAAVMPQEGEQGSDVSEREEAGTDDASDEQAEPEVHEQPQQNPPPGIKTPEQLLQELQQQQMNQQGGQQPQQQPAPAQEPPPPQD